ncbi:MAG TPA: hypothetical protein EYM84_08865 [Flavobacteriales bacterium]|nr:hypothetical protein [Flavobacteriales bacterium]HIN40369.1 hypothetical protein [Flavobacteriales bacterium]
MIKNRSSFILTCLGLMLLLGSCRKDTIPDVATREDYLGVWQCNEYDLNHQLIATFQIEIISHPDFFDKILIDNFNQLGQGFQLEAVINNTSIDFPQQILSSTTVSGHGFITDQLQAIELQYSVEDGTGYAENVDANCSKL